MQSHPNCYKERSQNLDSSLAMASPCLITNCLEAAGITGPTVDLISLSLQSLANKDQFHFPISGEPK